MSGLPEMPCRELVEVITEYLEGGLSPEDRQRFEEHLSGCPPCTDYVAQFRATIALAGRVDAGELPEETVRALTDAFRDWRRR